MVKWFAALIVAILVIVGAIWFVGQPKTSQIPTQNNEEKQIQPTAASAPFSWESLTYIKTVDWPPKVTTQNGPYSCTLAGEATQRAGKTEERTINGKKYCVTEVVEGAAGSIYTQYAYAVPTADGKVKAMTFSIRKVQCENYSEPQMTECKNEQSNFNIDNAISSELKTLN